VLSQFVKRLGASVAFSLLVLSVVTVPMGGEISSAYAAARKSAVGTLNASQMMAKMEQSLLLMATTYQQLPKAKKRMAAPFVKSMLDASKALKNIKAAVARKDRKGLAKALPQASAAIAKLTKAYSLSDLRNPKIQIGVTTLSSVWWDYVKRTPGSKTAASQDKALETGRRINGMKKQISKLKSNSRTDRRALAAIREMERILARAEAANRSLENQWLATLLFADAYGYYSGYYDYIVVYEPEYIPYYSESYTYYTSEYSYSYTEYTTYYEEYSWNYYEEPVEVYNEYNFNMSTTEYNRFEYTYVESYETVETTVETVYEQTDGYQAIQASSQEVDTQAANLESVAAIADPDFDQTVIVTDDTVSTESLIEEQAQRTADIAVEDPEIGDPNAPVEQAPPEETQPEAAPQTEEQPVEQPQEQPAEEPQDPCAVENPDPSVCGDPNAPVEQAPPEETQPEAAPQTEEQPVEQPQEQPAEEPQDPCAVENPDPSVCGDPNAAIEQTPPEETQPEPEPQAEEQPVEQPQEQPAEEPQDPCAVENPDPSVCGDPNAAVEQAPPEEAQPEPEPQAEEQPVEQPQEQPAEEPQDPCAVENPDLNAHPECAPPAEEPSPEPAAEETQPEPEPVQEEAAPEPNSEDPCAIDPASCQQPQ
jgi:hypothetical protein